MTMVTTDASAHPEAPPMVWVDGERQDSDGAHVSARDRGFSLGDAVFETMRHRGGQLFRYGAHRTRLFRALATLDIPEPAQLDQWVESAARVAGVAFGAAHASLRVTVTRGVGPTGLAIPSGVRPRVIVVAAAMPHFAPAIYEHGLAAHVARGRRNERAMTAGLKVTDYAGAVLALLEAQRAGADEALFLDTLGRCSEATASNLFASIGGHLLTPPTSCGALPGITRAIVMELAPRLGLRVVEEPFDLGTLLEAKEAFLTSSLRGVVPLVKVSGQCLGAGVPGERTRRVMQAYAALVERECSDPNGRATSSCSPC